MYKYIRVNTTHENMLRAVTAFALAPGNLSTTSSVPAFLGIINTIKTNNITVDALRSSIAQSVSGYAAQKKSLKATLASMTVTIMKATYAYAVANNNAVLAGKMKISRSRLKDMKYINIVSCVKGAAELITPLTAPLADYGITPSMLTLWQNTNSQLNQIISNPRNAIANRTAVNKQIQSTLRQSMQLLTEQADQLVLVFQGTAQNYYNQYLANRKLIPTHLSTQLRAHVQDELNQPISGATVSVDGTNLTALTDEKGYCLIPNIPFGDHIITITTGSATRSFGPFLFKKGKSLTKHFTTATAIKIPSSKPRTVELIH